MVSTIRIACGAIIFTVLPLLALMVARGPVDDHDGHLTRTGFWGAKTATVNWCERDYEVTPYVAEFGNAVSSLSIVAIGAFGMWAHWGRVEPRFLLAFGAFFCIGFGSCAFHGTLLRSMQLLDELPMVWANSVFIFIIIAMEDKRDHAARTLEIAALAVLTAGLTCAVVLLDKENQNVFLVSYGSGVAYLIVRSRSLDQKYSRGAHVLLETALIFYLGGFMLWLVDRNFCHTVRPIFLHCFWHLGAGVGTFTSVIFWIWVRHEVLELKPVLRGGTVFTRWVESRAEKAV
jgi:dihydroceramidase